MSFNIFPLGGKNKGAKNRPPIPASTSGQITSNAGNSANVFANSALNTPKRGRDSSQDNEAPEKKKGDFKNTPENMSKQNSSDAADDT